MKKDEIKIGHVYFAKVSGRVVPVRVLAARVVLAGPINRRREMTVYDCRNTVTGRSLTFRSAAKFRGESLTTATA